MIHPHLLCLFVSLISLLQCQQNVLRGTHEFPARYHKVYFQKDQQYRLQVIPMRSRVTAVHNYNVDLFVNYDPFAFFQRLQGQGYIMQNSSRDLYFKVQLPRGQNYYQLKIETVGKQTQTFNSFSPYPEISIVSNYIMYRVRKNSRARCLLVLEYFKNQTKDLNQNLMVRTYPYLVEVDRIEYETKIQFNYTVHQNITKFDGTFMIDYYYWWEVQTIQRFDFLLTNTNPDECFLEWNMVQDSYILELQGNSINIAVFIVPTVVGVVIIIVVLVCCWCRRRKNREGDESAPDNTANNLNRGVVSSENINQPNYEPSQPYQPYQLSQPYQPHQPYQPYFDPKIEVSEAKFSKTFEGIKTSCSICLDEKCNVQLKCKHYFHYKCITQWMRKNNLCPICRKKIEFSIQPI